MTEANACFKVPARLHQSPQAGRGGLSRLGVLLASVVFSFLVVSSVAPSDDALWLCCFTLLALGLAPAGLLAMHEWRLQAGDRYVDGDLRADCEGIEWTPRGEAAVRWGMNNIAAARVLACPSHTVMILTPIPAGESLAWEVERHPVQPEFVSAVEKLGKSSGPVVLGVRAPLTGKSEEAWIVLSPAGGMIVAIVAVCLDRLLLRSSVSFGMVFWFVPLLALFLLTFAAASATMMSWCSRPFERFAIVKGHAEHSGRPVRITERSRHSILSTSESELSLRGLTETGLEQDYIVQFVLFGMGSLQMDVVEACLSEQEVVQDGTRETRRPTES